MRAREGETQAVLSKGVTKEGGEAVQSSKGQITQIECPIEVMAPGFAQQHSARHWRILGAHNAAPQTAWPGTPAWAPARGGGPQKSPRGEALGRLVVFCAIHKGYTSIGFGTNVLFLHLHLNLQPAPAR